MPRQLHQQQSPDNRWRTLAGWVCGFLLAGAAAAGADDVEHRVVGVVPFPAHERSGAAVDVADVDALRFPQPGWVDVQFWDELVFKALDEPDYEDRRTFGLSDAKLADLDIYIKTTAPEEGVSPISEDMLGWWRQAIPEAVREITGEPWRGRILTGVDSRELTDGRINVGIGTEEYFADRDACATATTSYYAFPDGGYAEWAYAEILFNPDNDRCIFRDDSRGTTMAHEIGHVLGLFHVSDPAALMYKASGYDRGYTRQLVDHAQLLYELGPGLPYPGFGPAVPGTTPEEWTTSVDQVAHDTSRGVVTGRAWHNGGGQDVVTERQRVVALFVDAANDVIGESVHSNHRERSSPNTQWEFELPEREGWDRVLLVGVVFLGHTGEDGFLVGCTDAEGRGQSETVNAGDRRLRACAYQRSDIEVAGGPNPRDATKDLADQALEALQSQEDGDASDADNAAPEVNLEGAELALDAVEAEAEPVPALPLGGLGLLAGWLLLMGRLRRAKMTAGPHRLRER